MSGRMRTPLNYERNSGEGELFVEKKPGGVIIYLPREKTRPVYLLAACLALSLVGIVASLVTSDLPRAYAVFSAIFAGIFALGLAVMVASTLRRRTLDISRNGFRFSSTLDGGFRNEWIVLWADVIEILEHPYRHVIELRLRGNTEARSLDCRGTTYEETLLIVDQLELARAEFVARQK